MPISCTTPTCDTEYPHTEHSLCIGCKKKVGMPEGMTAIPNSTWCPKCREEHYGHRTPEQKDALRLRARVRYENDGVCKNCHQWRRDHINDKCLFESTVYVEDVDATFEAVRYY